MQGAAAARRIRPARYEEMRLQNGGNVMEWKDWAIVFATLAGPVLAVQAQKWIEAFREHRNRKHWVLFNLMATRGARLNMDHVRALNMIDMSFYGRRIFGFRWQTRSERAVCNAWHAYLEDLGVPHDQVDNQRRQNLFVAVLSAMASDLGFDFDRNQVAGNVYSPAGHWNEEEEQRQVRQAVIALATGRSVIKMDVERFPIDPEAAAANKVLNQKFAAAINDGALSVKVERNEV
jgi:hypothetical protein